MRDGERANNTGQNTGNGKTNVKGTENNQLSPQKPKGTEKGADLNKDVYELDEKIFPAGPYYNVKAARLAQAEEEIVVGEAAHEKRKEAGFMLSGDKRILQAQMRYRMDRAMCISASFDPANLICSGCKERGPHSVVGSPDGDPVVMVVTDQNFPAVMFSRDENPCIAVVRVEDGTTKEIAS